jgi:signal peptidase I
MLKYLRDLLITILIAAGIFFILQVTVGAIKIYGTSSFPNIQPEDYILMEKVTYAFRDPQRGEMIILHAPYNETQDLIKRVIGIPGDTVKIENKKVYVNGKALYEPYISDPPRYEMQEQTLPPGQYFVLGDNRNVAVDSHSGWLVNRSEVVGRAWFIYWPVSRIQMVPNYNLNTQLAN